jgi:putative ABC transport system permease protein
MLRALVKRPGFAAVVVATLALGLGATIGLFSVANAVLLRPLPYPNADRIVFLRTIAEDGTPTARVAPRDMPTLYDDHPALSAAALAFYTEGRITGNDDVDYNMGRYGVTDQFFEVFNVPMAMGRGFERGEPQGPVVISYATWRDVFASDPDILGKSIRVENGTRPVVGVTPEGFDFPGNAAYWTLMQLGPGYANLRGYLSYLRLKPETTLPQLAQQLAVLGSDLGPDAATGRAVRFAPQPLLDNVVGNLRPTVLLLFGATAVLLVIACINVANLLLARGTTRMRELAVRTALGEPRWRIFARLLTESLVLSVLGGIAGLVLGVVGIRLLLALGPADLPRLDSVPVDGTVLLFALAATLVTGLLFGVAPAWRLARVDLRTLVNDGGRGHATGRAQQRLFSSLVVAEIALAVVLVIGAGLLVRSYYNLSTSDPGFRTERTLSAFINVPGEAIQTFFPQPPAAEGGQPRFDASYRLIGDFFLELEGRVRALDGVESVSVSSSVPLSSQQWDPVVAFRIDGDAAPDVAESQLQATQRSVSPSFFSSMGISLREGRAFDGNDRRDSPGVAVVNETFARRYFADGRAVGRSLTIPASIYRVNAVGFQYGELVPDEFEIVGVVADAKYLSLGEPPVPSIYFSNEQYMLRRTNLIVRSDGSNPSALIPAIRAEIAALEPMPAEFELYSQVMRVSLARERLGMSLFAMFGAVALALAAVGVYGLMSYSVAQRKSEIAVRSALGASQRQIVGGVVARGVWLGLAGIAIGVVVAAATGRVIASELYGVGTLDWAVFVAVPLALLAVALVAAYVPARRASRIDPAAVLQME